MALVLAAWRTPSLCDGYAALQWTRHYAGGGGGEPAREMLRLTARQAVRAVERLAPLPQAAEAARLALAVGQRLAGERPREARALYAQVRASLEGRRGLGFSSALEEARALEAASEARERPTRGDAERRPAPSPPGREARP
jgi:hypothetical protein